MRYLESFGDRIASRDSDNQAPETYIRLAPLNRSNAPCTAEIECSA